MARSIRVEYEGAWYHAMAQGNRREPIFLDYEGREVFLKALGESSQMTGWEVHAWVLMPNHYHMVIRTPEALDEYEDASVTTPVVRRVCSFGLSRASSRRSDRFPKHRYVAGSSRRTCDGTSYMCSHTLFFTPPSQLPRRPPQSLSLGSFGGVTRSF